MVPRLAPSLRREQKSDYHQLVECLDRVKLPCIACSLVKYTCARPFLEDTLELFFKLARSWLEPFVDQVKATSDSRNSSN